MPRLEIEWVAEPPPSRGHREAHARPEAIPTGRLIESALMSNPHCWAKVDEVPEGPHGFPGSAIYALLWRHGFEVVARKNEDEPGLYDVYARWPQECPWGLRTFVIERWTAEGSKVGHWRYVGLWDDRESRWLDAHRGSGQRPVEGPGWRMTPINVEGLFGGTTVADVRSAVYAWLLVLFGKERASVGNVDRITDAVLAAVGDSLMGLTERGERDEARTAARAGVEASSEDGASASWGRDDRARLRSAG